jgi:pimeloyl-ACP methyl ester carboxylesterase
MAAKTTIKVPHLGGIEAGYRSTGIDPKKPTIVLINSMCTTSSLYNEQFDSKSLTDAVNLLAIEPLGHGATMSNSEHFTYWDSATMALQVMEALGVERAFALGTSQGGWMVVRMALLAPEKVSTSPDRPEGSTHICSPSIHYTHSSGYQELTTK